MPSFASLLAIPSSVTLRFIRSYNASLINGFETDFAPTLASGAKFNLTNTTAYALTLDNGEKLGTNPYASKTVANTLLTAGATGGSLSVTSSEITADINNLQANTGAQGGKVSITATDGTNVVVVATGTWGFSIVP